MSKKVPTGVNKFIQLVASAAGWMKQTIKKLQSRCKVWLHPRALSPRAAPTSKYEAACWAIWSRSTWVRIDAKQDMSPEQVG